MKSLPFTAKVGKVVQKVGSDLPQLSQAKADVAEQLYLPKIAKSNSNRACASVPITWTWGGR